MKSGLPFDEEEILLSSQFENMKPHCKTTAAVIEEKRDERIVIATQLDVDKVEDEMQEMQRQNEIESGIDIEESFMESEHETYEADELSEQLEEKLEAMKKGDVDVLGIACNSDEGSQSIVLSQYMDSVANRTNDYVRYERKILMSVMEQQAAYRQLHYASTSSQSNIDVEGNMSQMSSQGYSSVNAEHETLHRKRKAASLEPYFAKKAAVMKERGNMVIGRIPQQRAFLEDLRDRKRRLEEQNIELQNELDSCSDMEKQLTLLKRLAVEAYDVSEQLEEEVDSLGMAGVYVIYSDCQKGSWLSEERDALSNMIERIEENIGNVHDCLLLKVENQQAALSELHFQSSSVQADLAAQRDVLRMGLRDRAGVDAELEELRDREKKAEEIGIECDRMADALGTFDSVTVPLLNELIPVAVEEHCNFRELLIFSEAVLLSMEFKLMARRTRDQEEAEEDGPGFGTENELTAIGCDTDRIMKSGLPFDEEEILLSSQFENMKPHYKTTAAVIEEKRDERIVIATQLDVDKVEDEMQEMQRQNEIESGIDIEESFMESEEETDEAANVKCSFWR
ncbi:myosin-11-like isoform X4 [Zootermopsis nevadensis]|nr:myosin-11-like isoform X4 [Zootermopsis nevadensis]